ncbi:hypothetical protein RFI_09691 [Reticulomyxa filosa]|uniref:Uncharacterized protein n=1 Tax=Reticulomyxa filosa TaxID=46433 RepID=X6NN90_RETFI|nr:hypothetical protein RFI_09691 [Reticulomyxa filosa]|eukprot:ETO27441.1 hypothetical protein RFI_09691 [Reticulomyxa filosa]
MERRFVSHGKKTYLTKEIVQEKNTSMNTEKKNLAWIWVGEKKNLPPKKVKWNILFKCFFFFFSPSPFLMFLKKKKKMHYKFDTRQNQTWEKQITNKARNIPEKLTAKKKKKKLILLMENRITILQTHHPLPCTCTFQMFPKKRKRECKTMCFCEQKKKKIRKIKKTKAKRIIFIFYYFFFF